MTMHVLFKGNIQGVGFRAAVLKFARALHLRGTVANLDDGTVEAYFLGDLSEINQCIQSIKLQFGSNIEDTVIKAVELPDHFDQFNIRQ